MLATAQKPQLTDRELTLRKLLRDDFIEYSQRALFIRPKKGDLKPLKLNRAQKYLHQRIEEQRARLGWVRALILKGRQQGCCLAPNTRVLRADLTWVSAESINPGDEVVSCDEEHSGRSSRKMRTAVVEAVAFFEKPLFRITFADGTHIDCTDDHRWLTRKSQAQWEWRKIRDGNKKGIVPGTEVRFVVSPWDKSSFEDGWFGGIIDGEGSFSTARETGASVRISQRPGSVLSRCETYLSGRGYPYSYVSDNTPVRRTKFGGNPVDSVEVSRMGDLFRLFGQTRPTRAGRFWEGKKLPHTGAKLVTSIEPLGIQRVVDLQTSTKTFIAEGLVSHNSTYVEGRFYWRVSHRKGVRAYILTHEDSATQNLYEMATRYHEQCPPILRPHTGTANAKELYFDLLDSGYKVGTAGTKAVGRSSTLQFFHGCLSCDTSIVDGVTGSLRRMSDMVVGDLVRTHRGAIAKVSAVSRQSKRALSVTLKGMGQLPLVATPEHRFLTGTGWAELSTLVPGDKILFPVPTIIDAGVRWDFRLPPTNRPQGGGSGNHGPKTVVPSYELGRALGLYLAEGCVIKQSGSGNPSSVCFAVHERETARTQEWLEACGELVTSIKTVPRKDSKTVTVTAYGRSFAAFVLRLCGELDSKRMPDSWQHCGIDFTRGVVHGYLAGDGHSSKREYDRRISAPSIRAAITVGMRDALASLGYGWACIAYHPGRLRYGKVCKPLWTLRLCGEGVDVLCQELGWTMPPRRRNAVSSIVVRDGYAHIPIVQIKDAGDVEVMDFEVDHPDHSYCTVHAATHNSEVAFWPFAEDHAAGVLQAVPREKDTEILLESTANGIGNLFHSMWQDAERGAGDYIAVFLPWWWQDEYTASIDGFTPTPEELAYQENSPEITLAHLAWRRIKITEIGEDLFKREYPANAAEAFQATGEESFITPASVLKARKSICTHDDAPLICGLDPAYMGSDRTVFAFRRGRRVYNSVTLKGKDNMEVAGFCANILRSGVWLPDAQLPVQIVKVFIDLGGMPGIYDRLRELGFGERVIGVNFGSNALQESAYVNRRAEMWGLLKEWLKGPCQLPDSDTLQADLCGVQHSFDSSGRLKLEQKEHMRKRGLRSPDEGDALALTFALPVARGTSIIAPLEQRQPNADGFYF